MIKHKLFSLKKCPQGHGFQVLPSLGGHSPHTSHLNTTQHLHLAMCLTDPVTQGCYNNKTTSDWVRATVISSCSVLYIFFWL